MAVEIPQALRELDIEWRLPEQMTSEQIQRTRNLVHAEAMRVAFPGIYDVYIQYRANEDGTVRPVFTQQKDRHTSYDVALPYDPEKGVNVQSDAEGSENIFPFGKPIAHRELREEDEPRQDVFQRQIAVSLRYLDELMEIDRQVCGDGSKEYPGMKLPLQEVKRSGRRRVSVKTNNSWGAERPLPEDVHAEFVRASQYQNEEGETRVDNEEYSRLFKQWKKQHPQENTGGDLPVLNEEDSVLLFTKNGEMVGRAVVTDATGDAVELRVHSTVPLRKGMYMQKKSDKGRINLYKKELHEMCRSLHIENDLSDRYGQPYKWDSEKNDDPLQYFDEHRKTRRRLNKVEREFFDREDAMSDYDPPDPPRNYTEKSIPRALLDDIEQSTGFAVAAMGNTVTVMHGPGGTGKTTVASHLTEFFQRQGLKTLVCSHSNKGLDNLLRAIRKRKVDLHRAGTEMNVCDPALRDVFIRRGLTPPRASDYVTQEFDYFQYKSACTLWRDGDCVGPEPDRKNFMVHLTDAIQMQAAWDAFYEKKRAIVAELEKESGLTVGVTLNTLITDEILAELDFDVVIIDEASKGFFHEYLPALRKAGIQIIFIGDHKQLGNVDLTKQMKLVLADSIHCDSESGFADGIGSIDEEDVERFADGPFPYLMEETNFSNVLLSTNRRQLAALGMLVSKAGYDSELYAGCLDPIDPENIGEIKWVDTAAREDRSERSHGVSKVNHLEARLIARQLKRDFEQGLLFVVEEQEKGADGKTFTREHANFGVINTYRGQARLIMKKLKKLKFDDKKEKRRFLKLMRGAISTVDAFQGSERDRIYLSTVRSNEHEKVGFLDDVRRINVAAGRAKRALTIFGDTSTIIDANPDEASRNYFAAAHATCEKYGTVIEEYPDLPGHLKANGKPERSTLWQRVRERRRKMKK